MTNPSTAQARIVVDELIRGGVRDVVLCPGSRSAGVAFALAAGWGLGGVALKARRRGQWPVASAATAGLVAVAAGSAAAGVALGWVLLMALAGGLIALVERRLPERTMQATLAADAGMIEDTGGDPEGASLMRWFMLTPSIARLTLPVFFSWSAALTARSIGIAKLMPM